MIRLKNCPVPPKPVYEQGTVDFWLDQLPEPYRTLAFRNRKNLPMFGSYADSRRAVKSMFRALSDAFSWGESDQGCAFWQELALWTENPTTNPIPEVPHD